MKKAYFYLFIFVLSYTSWSQIVGTHCYLMRNAVEMAVANCGTFGVSATPPAGYHPNVSGRFGFVADPPKNGWTTPGPAAFPNYMGDYFTPGSPEEGWGLEFNIGATNYNYGSYNLCGSSGTSGAVPGGITAYNVTPTSRQAVWQGTVMGMQVTQTTTIFTDSLYILTCVNIQNTSGATRSNVYFSRSVDPDNEQPWTGNFTTTNTIVYQQPMSSGSRALVSAVGLTHNAYLGLGTKDTRARVIYGGFFNRDPSNIWNMVGFTGTLGATNTADQAISIAFSLGDMPAGSCATFAYVYILSAAQLESALNATSPSFYAGTTDITASGSTNICVGESVTLNILGGGNACGATGWNWTWSPAAGLSTTTGTTVVASPTTTTTYTATATDVCGSVVFTKNITINVVACLPVGLQLSGGLHSPRTAILSWNYPDDISLKHFEVERNKSGDLGYEKVATFNAVAGQNGYEYTDANLSAGTYLYRIRKVNKDGSDTYSNTVEITVNPVSESFAVHSIAPNPAFDNVTIRYSSDISGKVQFAIYDLAGKKLKDIYEGTMSTGQYTQQFSVSDLPNGNYLVMAMFNGNSQHFRLNVIR
jgi:hypothetical protein